MISVERQEIIELYLLLRRSPDDLSVSLRALLSRIERLLYDRLTIEELERLEDGEADDIDLLTNKL